MRTEMTSGKTKFKIEFVLNTQSTTVLWNLISSAHGLEQWFADKVTNDKDIFHFQWNGSAQNAKVAFVQKHLAIRFKWENEPKNTFFEFKIMQDEVTRMVSLIITDFAEADEMEDSQRLWEKQIKVLKQHAGM